MSFTLESSIQIQASSEGIIYIYIYLFLSTKFLFSSLFSILHFLWNLNSTLDFFNIFLFFYIILCCHRMHTK
jgi:hypothetical protein